VDAHCHERAGVEAHQDEEKWGVHGNMGVAHVLCVVSKIDTACTKENTNGSERQCCKYSVEKVTRG
jgi:hypothetical protein